MVRRFEDLETKTLVQKDCGLQRWSEFPTVIDSFLFGLPVRRLHCLLSSAGKLEIRPVRYLR